MKIKRDTNTVLMDKVFEMTKRSGCYEKAGAIIEYYSPERFKVKELTHYKFDFVARVGFGSNEGIFIDCYNADSNERQQLHCGFFKTLSQSMKAMQIMGELAGALTFFASEYVNAELDRYTPAA